MKFFVTPAPFFLIDPFTKNPIEGAPLITAEYFVSRYLLASPEIGKTNGQNDPPGVVGRRVKRISAAFENATEGSVIGIEEDEYLHLILALNKLSFDDPRVTPQMLPYIEAFEKTATQDEAWKRDFTNGATSVSKSLT